NNITKIRKLIKNYNIDVRHWKYQYRNYTEQDIINNAAKVKSLSALLKSLGLRVAGGNFNNMKRKLQHLNINTEHWTGQAWCKEEQLKDFSEYTSYKSIKPHIIKLRGHKCEKCNNTHWFKKKITLEIHHIDGNRTNNEENNLQLLCPNCHSQTKNWRNKANGIKVKINCQTFNSITSAAKEFNVSTSVIKRKLHSDDYPNYQYV
ncbi:MAG: HNH endonuclease, partial [Romboutsia sp.]|nr:HNH endonuclease [Romboutsia sp.]